MSRPLLPPRGLFIRTGLLFDRRIPSAVLPTLLQLMALAWGSREHATPPLPMRALCDITMRPPRTLYGHLAVLRDQLAALRMLPAGDGLVSLVFADWLYPPAQGSPGATAGGAPPAPAGADPFRQLLQMPDEEEQATPSPRLLNPSPPPDQRAGRAGSGTTGLLRQGGGRRPLAPGSGAPRLPAELEAALLEAGVFPSLLPEVAASGLEPADLWALLAWCRADEPQQPARLFMARLRHGGRPPAVYHQPACPRCGRQGGHEADCPQRYLDGPYGGYLER